jgi:hypothetical protein
MNEKQPDILDFCFGWIDDIIDGFFAIFKKK